ncbi:MAG: FecR domain-containing protein, partial [Proteobacteria bacterium]|nr:FecR domain-containing protein [Pseudomonadota bacterium]
MGFSLSLRFVVLCVVLLAPLAVQAQSQRGGGEIGVTAAVNPNATGAAPLSEPRLLEVGVNVFANERIVTTAVGQAQMPFIDESAFTVGPNSEVVLDEFVFDPDTGTGKLALTAAKGVFRFVGGKISKNSPVTLKTPTAVIGIRGGIALVNVQPDGATRATFLFGDQMTVVAGGVTQIATRPGFAITAATPDQAPSPPARAAPAQLNAALNSLERSAPPPADDGNQQEGGQQQPSNQQQQGSQGQQDDQQQGQADGQQGQDGQGQGNQPPQRGGQQIPTDQDVAQTSLGDQGSRQAPRVVALRRLFGPAPRPPPPGASADGPAPGQTANEAQQNNNLQQNLAPSATDLSGRYKRSVSRLGGTADQSSTSNIAFSGGQLQSGSFSVPLGSNTLKFPISGTGVTAIASAGSTASPNGTFIGNVFLSPNAQFTFLEGVETGNTTNRIVAFAGKPSGAIPTSGASYYALQDDFGLNSPIPFMRLPDANGITVGQAETAADAAIYWDVSGSSTAQRSFGFRTISITGQGLTQKSAISFGGGAVLLDSQSRPFIRGGAIGSARQNLAGLPTVTDSELSSADDALGNDFFGPNGSFFVLESASVNVSDAVVTNNGASRFGPGGSPLTTSFFPSNVAVPASSTLGTRSTRTMGGYLGGAYQSEVAGALSTTTMLFGFNNDSFDVEIKTNAAANKVRGSF